MWYRADHAAANAGCALVAGYPAGLLRHHRVSAGAIASGKAQGGPLVVAWANEWGYLLEPGEDIHADRARAVLLTPGGTYRCTRAFAPDTPAGWFVAPLYRSEHRRPHQGGSGDRRGSTPASARQWSVPRGRATTGAP
jgi:hypothetical protein